MSIPPPFPPHHLLLLIRGISLFQVYWQLSASAADPAGIVSYVINATRASDNAVVSSVLVRGQTVASLRRLSPLTQVSNYSCFYLISCVDV